jgi:hypothetical protein
MRDNGNTEGVNQEGDIRGIEGIDLGKKVNEILPFLDGLTMSQIEEVIKLLSNVVYLFPIKIVEMGANQS